MIYFENDVSPLFSHFALYCYNYFVFAFQDPLPKSCRQYHVDKFLVKNLNFI